ncbi:hypothetical protein QBC38DRAFT_485769 [Podospora fimiseda]|uniref:DUF7907 domain-containing protein n=1 Tax=Podospora fimiseda TaxID=252190 RepID=A0AAN7BIU2_9PEZI|nr:hypothetical protein QBC38DRAFT_485769 [Podospora fimiseda]
MLPLLLLSTFSLTSATDPGCIPRHSASLGFHLRVNITSPSDFTPSINLHYLSTAHIGPAQNRAIISPSPGPVFYQNGTYSDITFHTLSILTDAGSPPGVFPEAITYLPDDANNSSAVYINAGLPGSGTSLSRLWDPYSYLTILEGVVESTFVVCNRTIPYYGENKWFNVVNWVQATRDGTGTHIKIPEGCVAVNLIPECAFLEELPEGAYSSHEFAQEVRCYEDVGEIEWWRYSF